MSKHKDTKPALADWELVIDQGAIPARVEVLPQTRWKRDDRGYYTFRDSKGVLAEFAPGFVLSVRRLEVVLAPDEKALAAVAARTELAAKQANGGR